MSIIREISNGINTASAVVTFCTIGILLLWFFHGMGAF